ncbi:ornithine decarboxylase [Vibrio cholerae]|nr:ornithine decarboxylase [Vibrio cholerae]
MFRARYFPRAVMNPQEANLAFVRGQALLPRSRRRH